MIVGIVALIVVVVVLGASIATLLVVNQAGRAQYERLSPERRRRWVTAIVVLALSIAVLAGLAIVQVFGPRTWIWILGIGAGLCVILMPIAAAIQARRDLSRARQHRP